MNWFIGIAIAVIVLLVMIIMLSACKAASLADQLMEHAFAEWLAAHPEDGLPK